VLLKEIVIYLGERAEPLQAADAPARGRRAPASGMTGREVSLGTMPDFAFAGPGVRISRVMPGSAAEEAHLEDGDVITRIDEHEIADLKAYSEILKKYSPGDEITVHLVRGEENLSVRATLRAR
jgi:S1-C subfamily serine protease